MTTSLVLFRAWLQRSGSSLGEVVGRVEVEDESLAREVQAGDGQNGANWAAKADDVRTRRWATGFFFQHKSAQYSASGIGWTQTTFQTLSPDAQLACEPP